MSDWPNGNKEKHAAAARKGWETRRRNAEMLHGGNIGATTRARNPHAPETRNKVPGVKAAQVKGKRAREAEFRHRVVTLHEEADKVAYELGGIDVRIVAEAKKAAGFYHKWIEKVSRQGMVRGYWEDVFYAKEKRAKARSK